MRSDRFAADDTAQTARHRASSPFWQHGLLGRRSDPQDLEDRLTPTSVTRSLTKKKNDTGSGQEIGLPCDGRRAEGSGTGDDPVVQHLRRAADPGYNRISLPASATIAQDLRTIRTAPARTPVKTYSSSRSSCLHPLEFERSINPGRFRIFVLPKQECPVGEPLYEHEDREQCQHPRLNS